MRVVDKGDWFDLSHEYIEDRELYAEVRKAIEDAGGKSCEWYDGAMHYEILKEKPSSTPTDIPMDTPHSTPTSNIPESKPTDEESQPKAPIVSTNGQPESKVPTINTDEDKYDINSDPVASKISETSKRLKANFGPSPLEKATARHEQCHSKLSAQLEQEGYEIIASNGVVDIVAKKQDEVLSIEIKTFNKEHVRSQIFQAVGQLFYSRYYSFPPCKLALAVPRNSLSFIQEPLQRFLDDLHIELWSIEEEN